MDLLTNRFIWISSQVFAILMADLREKESLELKRVRDYKRSMRTIGEENAIKNAVKAIAAESHLRKTKFGNVVCLKQNVLKWTNKEETKENKKQDEQTIGEENVYTSKAIAAESQLRKTKLGNAYWLLKQSSSKQTENEENKENTKQDEQKNEEGNANAKETTTAGRIGGVYKKNQNDGSKINELNESSVPKPSLNKFRKAAKTTVLIQTLKSGRSICTCENLNAHCKVHDSKLDNCDGNESNEPSEGDSVGNSPSKTSNFQNAARTTALVKNHTCEDPDDNGPRRVYVW